MKSKNVEISVVDIPGSKNLALTDAGTRQKYAGNATAITLTIPLNSVVDFPVNTVIQVARLGSGGISYAGATSDVTLNGGTLPISHVGTGTLVELWQESVNKWWVMGSRL